MTTATDPVLARLLRVTARESDYLGRTERRLASAAPDIDWVRSLPESDARSELLDAFVSRYGRLQDTLGDKLMPALLRASLERTGSQLDNLLRAEKLGWIDSVDGWIGLRELRNRLVHEYVDTPERLLMALTAALEGVSVLVATRERLAQYAQQHGWDGEHDPGLTTDPMAPA